MNNLPQLLETGILWDPGAVSRVDKMLPLAMGLRGWETGDIPFMSQRPNRNSLYWSTHISLKD